MKMTSENLDELVFENRNKEYGAYVIRKEYPESLKTGIYVTLAFVGSIVLCSFLIKTGEVIKDVVIPTLENPGVIVDIPRPPVDPPAVPEKPAGGPKINSVIPLVTDKPVETPLTPAPPDDVPVSPGEGPGAPPEGPATSGPVGPTVTDAPPVEPPPTLIADEMPEMDGGVTKFLRKNLTYPETAVIKKTSGTVYISFVVEKDGSVGNVNVMKGIGDGCEEEATRVVKKMKWRPGKNHGHPVRVQFTLPVKFTINE